MTSRCFFVVTYLSMDTFFRLTSLPLVPIPYVIILPVFHPLLNHGYFLSSAYELLQHPKELARQITLIDHGTFRVTYQVYHSFASSRPYCHAVYLL